MKKLVNIEKVAEVNPKLPTYSKSSETPVTFIPMSAVSEQGKIIKPEENILKNVVKGYRYFEKGDVLLAKITPCMENGKATLVEKVPHDIGFGSTEFHVIRPKSEIDGRYLFYMLWNSQFRHIAEQNMTGTAGQRRVPADFIKRYKIPLPPIAEQRRIACILDKADEIRRKRQEAIKLTEELGRSLFLDLFGDPVTNPKGWEIATLKDFGKIITGNTPPRADLDNYGDHIEWIKSDNITTPYHFLTKASEKLSIKGKEKGRVVPSGSVLVVCIAGSRSSIGRVSIADREVAFNQQINAIIPNRDIDTYFLYCHFLACQNLVQKKSTDSMKGLVSKSKFSSIKFIKPPESKQRIFGKQFQKFLEINQKLENYFISSENLFNSLLQRAFKGEL